MFKIRTLTHVAAALAVTTVLAHAAPAASITVTTGDFEGVQLREANDGTSGHGTISDVLVGGSAGFYANTPAAGQKVYVGTEALDGLYLGSIESISFTYAYKKSLENTYDGPNNRVRNGVTESDASYAERLWPYNNFIVTDGQGSWGMIAATTGSRTSVGTFSYNGEEWNASTVQVSFNLSSLKMYEQVGGNAFGTHGHKLTSTEVDELMAEWMVGSNRPLSAGEGGVARGPVEHGFTINWGDSNEGYLGERLIYDIEVTAIPEPAAFGVFGLAGLGLLRRRRA